MAVRPEPYSLLIEASDGEYSVWVSLPDHDPIKDAFGFVIGTGVTRDQAVAAAVVELEDLLGRLQGPPGTIEERHD